MLGAIAAGGTNRQIALDLGMTTKTVMHHSTSVYRKLGLRSRAAAAAWAVGEGLTAGD